MDGLEAVEISFSDLERTLRIDSGYYLKEFIEADTKLVARNLESLIKVTRVSDGNHMKISHRFVDMGVPYYRGQDVNSFFVEQSEPNMIDREAFEWSYMKRSHLKRGDVLLSIVGTIGQVSLVGENKPATCSCKLAILRPKHVDAKIISSGYLAVFLNSKYGQFQIKRLTRGTVQMGLILEDMDQLLVPRLSPYAEKMIHALVDKAKSALVKSELFYTNAEKILLAHLSLKDWQPSKENVSVKNFSNSFGDLGRLDAEYYQPKYDELFEAIKRGAVYQRQIKDFRTYNARGLQPEYVEGGQLAVINSRHILEQHLDYDNFEKVGTSAWHEQKKARVFENDILTYTTGANIGRTNVYLKPEHALVLQLHMPSLPFVVRASCYGLVVTPPVGPGKNFGWRG